MRRRLFLILLTLLTLTAASASAQGLPRAVRTTLIEAVVQIIPWDDAAGDFAPWSGSGTIISPDGYILTNFHVIGDSDTREHYEYHAIFMTRANATDQPPVMNYWARYVAADPTHDLALLKIVEYPDETPVPAELTFPSVIVGDSNDLLPGDTITIVGYPGISGSTITFTAGLMSGWLGEDFEAGGKQWIKTDGKIAHGNSGGGAFNERGELIGVPTAGRTVAYEELDVEEQAYVRPISLGWALIGPNVRSVSTAQAAPPVTPPPSAAAGEPSGEYGTVVLGSSTQGVIAAAPADDVTFHGYSVDIPAGLSSLTINLSGDDADLDLAVKLGAPISNYDEVDYLDVTEEPNPSYTVSNPPAGLVYLDVINLQSSPADYVLSVVGEPTGNPLGSSPANPTNPLAPGPLSVSGTGSTTVGALLVGQTATGRLQGVADSASYHTFFVDVAPGTPRLVISLAAEADLDLAVRHGTEIGSYRDQAEGGDWDYRDNSTAWNAEFAIDNPEAGRWYIDVYNALGADVTAGYSLRVQ